VAHQRPLDRPAEAAVEGIVGTVNPPRKTDYTDVSDVGVDEQRREDLYTAQTECSVTWTNRDGWPVGVVHRYVWRDDSFWVTCTRERKRVPALLARPQSCVIVTSEGTWLGGDITTTAKTLATVHTDADIKAWFYPTLAARLRRGDAAGQAEFLRRLDTPTRVVIELKPVSWITYDGIRLESALRGLEFDPSVAKETRNLMSPPDGRTLRRFD
jgi:hypothetical protein